MHRGHIVNSTSKGQPLITTCWGRRREQRELANPPVDFAVADSGAFERQPPLRLGTQALEQSARHGPVKAGYPLRRHAVREK